MAAEVDMIEIRADLMPFSDEQLIELLNLSEKSIFTCRPNVCSEARRMELFSLAVKNGASFIDLEIESDPELIKEIHKLLADTPTELILSYHNFEKTPPLNELKEIMTSCYSAGAALAKMATMILDEQDLQTIFSLYAEPGRKVLIGMGEKGIITRVAATFFGAEFSFASPENDDKTAPGQLSLNEMKDIFKILKAEENSVSSHKN